MLVAAYFPQSRGEAIGEYNALKGAGYVVAPAIGGFIVVGVEFRWRFSLSLRWWGLLFLEWR